MTVYSISAFAAAAFSGALALAVAFRKEHTVASSSFCLGMVVLGIESVLRGLSSSAASPESIQWWERVTLQTRSFLPALWLCFSLTFSRGNARDFLGRSRWLVLAAFVV